MSFSCTWEFSESYREERTPMWLSYPFACSNMAPIIPHISYLFVLSKNFQQIFQNFPKGFHQTICFPKVRVFFLMYRFLCFGYLNPCAWHPIPNEPKEQFLPTQEFLQLWMLKWPGIFVWFHLQIEHTHVLSKRLYK